MKSKNLLDFLETVWRQANILYANYPAYTTAFGVILLILLII